MKHTLLLVGAEATAKLLVGRYNRAAAFDVPSFKAYTSTSGLDKYIAYYGTSSTGRMSTTIVGQNGYAVTGTRVRAMRAGQT